MENNHEFTHVEVRCILNWSGEESQNDWKVILKLCTGGTVVKSLPTKQETWVPSLDREDLLEKGIALSNQKGILPGHKNDRTPSHSPASPETQL